MFEIINYLKDPHLVARIQRYYGVEVVSPLNSSPVLTSSNGNISRSPHSGDDEAFAFKRRLEKEEAIGTSVHNTTSESKECIDNGIKSNGCVSCEPEGDETFSSESEPESKGYIITNWVWYYLFVLGTALGDEIFYASFIPFWFWNIDGAVGRRVVLVWTVIMYIGQGIKDVVRWPRPSCPPVVRLQKKWALEYGMPSTHAMVGVSIPLSVILYTMNRYQYSVSLGVLFAIGWCSVICLSRLYLGMHSVLDIVVGIVLAFGLMVPVVPLVDALDHYLLTSHWSPAILLITAICLVVFYPSSDRWTPTRGDTTMVLSVCVGVHVGAWTNYQLGVLSESPDSPPYAIIWPSYEMLGLSALRTVIGFCCIVATRALCKSASYATVCTLLRLNSRELQQSQNSIKNRQKITVELSYTFITYALLGFNTVYLLPSVFRLMSIERPTFYTEI
ncbi:Sphingosine-1-phosphate phosphatase 1 [Cryptotermes secundus]|uniref:Sphingosine-1-phosphate phosphatase 1 n=1 Tax=Cryptotermes secundus TaxID=105785 RepID=A0A2J7R4Y5_9NEOP|nr:sphingosine-1-phosphate phosphatase 2 [Cryptotermes secundus]PNF35891.1 Sphingosine-1-phosphate phosphatase 1 [Cryptotermes secundus]